MAEPGWIDIRVSYTVGEEPTVEETAHVRIPPDYRQRDIDALTVRLLEDTTFALTRREFGRQPTKTALLAYAARQLGIERALDEDVSSDGAGLAALRLKLRIILALSNDQAIDLYGEDPEGQ
jgi:hypothetical protein